MYRIIPDKVQKSIIKDNKLLEYITGEYVGDANHPINQYIHQYIYSESTQKISHANP